MTHRNLIVCVLMSLVASPVVAQSQSLGSEHTRPAGPSTSSDLTQMPRSSWEGWLKHGERDRTSTSSIPSRSPDLGTPTTPLSPSLGPEASRSPSRLQPNSDRELVERGIGSERR
ncbi:MAG: hypothetical protein NBKEAIPA_02473 [Nitrospirae bacterium]|nr:MAG: hypothetical protein UZ03_NOB001002836 [Nitrospira sp. OLB3]MBV6470557.1 hypothetical protein [Nitrospirota bacterium]